MAKLNRKEFASACGKTMGYVNVNVQRGNIIVGDDKLIDTANPVNRDTLMRLNPESNILKKAPRNKTKNKREPASAKSKKEISDYPEETGADISTIDLSDDNLDIGGLSSYDLDRLKKKADIELKAESIKNKKLERAKLMGESVPTKLVKSVITTFSREIIRTYNENIEKLSIEFSHKHKLSAEQKAELNGEMKRMINKSHDDAITEAKKTLNQIIKETKNG